MGEDHDVLFEISIIVKCNMKWISPKMVIVGGWVGDLFWSLS